MLGSTPEYRDLLARRGYREVHVIDNSDAFHDRMTRHMAYAGLASERFYNRSWQSHFASSPTQYDLILGDLTLGNVPYQDRRQMYADLFAAMNRGGFFIDRTLTNEGHRWTADEIASRYRDCPINIRTVNDFNCEAVFCSALAVNASGVLDTGEVYNRLTELESPEIKKLVSECQIITPAGMRWCYGRPWATVAQDYAKGLTLLSKTPSPPGSPYRDHAFLFTYTKE